MILYLMGSGYIVHFLIYSYAGLLFLYHAHHLIEGMALVQELHFLPTTEGEVILEEATQVAVVGTEEAEEVATGEEVTEVMGVTEVEEG